VQFQGVDVANVPDGQYAPAGHAQRYGDRGEGLCDAALRCHEYPQIDDVFTFDAVNTVGKTHKGKVHSESTQEKKEETEPCSIYIYTVAGKEGEQLLPPLLMPLHPLLATNLPTPDMFETTMFATRDTRRDSSSGNLTTAKKQ
jgi:hypothetical protein